MIDTIYVEDAIVAHPRTRAILQRFQHARQIPCERYTEVFNPKSQQFRLQKRRPSLILARKPDHFLLETPAGYGVGGGEGWYFSHMLNCLYDCRYCFLQGMYRSAHYVLFVNYEDFMAAIEQRRATYAGTAPWFFSGYDCDSLALEPVTGFVRAILPFFATRRELWLELRTKSTQIRCLLERAPLPNCVVAFSFTPTELASVLEHRVPEVERRLGALVRLQEAGWLVGLRFDPVIYDEDYRSFYRRLFADVFSRLRVERLHSVSLGAFRLPRAFRRNIERLYPDEPLFAGPLEEHRGMVSYRSELEQDLLQFCESELLRYIPSSIFYPCVVEG